MKRWIVIVTLVTLGSVGLAGCSTSGTGSEADLYVVGAKRGNMNITISGSGNIEASEDAKLSFGVSGRVEKIYAEEGDRVSKGDMLAKLETDVLELAVTQARVALAERQVAVTQAEVALSGRQVAITQAEVALTGQQVGVTQSEVALTEQQVAVTQAQVTLETAEYNLYEAQDIYVWRDIRTAQSDVDEAQRYLDDVLWALNQASGPGVEFKQKAVIHAQARLDTAEDILGAMLAGTDPQEVDIKNLEVELAQQSLKLARQSEELARQSLVRQRQSEELARQALAQEQGSEELDRQSLELARQSVEEARESLEYAQKTLDRAIITAPFDGVVADVAPEEGDTVNSATQIIYLVDPGIMELVLKMDEMDVPRVTLNQEAIISVDSLPSVNFEGRVTSIYPTPIVVGGVVLYKTKISFNVPDDSGIKVGMSAIADIVIGETKDVVLVPKQAIEKNEKGGTQVGVMVNGKIQKKPVVTGMNDGIYTEILSGLSEGESVIINRINSR